PDHLSRDCTNPTVPKPSHLFSDSVPSAPVFGNKNNDSYYRFDVPRRVSAPKCDPKPNVLDSGSSSHHNNDVNKFNSLQPLNDTPIVLADGSQCHSVGVGNVSLRTNGEPFELKEVKYTPEFDTNLISVSKLTDDGCTVVFDQSEATVLMNG